MTIQPRTASLPIATKHTSLRLLSTRSNVQWNFLHGFFLPWLAAYALQSAFLKQSNPGESLTGLGVSASQKETSHHGSIYPSEKCPQAIFVAPRFPGPHMTGTHDIARPAGSRKRISLLYFVAFAVLSGQHVESDHPHWTRNAFRSRAVNGKSKKEAPSERVYRDILGHRSRVLIAPWSDDFLTQDL